MKSRELAAKRGQKPVSPTCAFCRTAVPESNEEIFAQLRKRVELNDPNALCQMALCYGNGDQGLPLDQAKCIGLLRQSADLGFPTAQYHLGNFHKFGDMGIEQNREEALKYLKEAAEGGIVFAMHNLGCDYSSNGDLVAAMRYWRSSASGGYRRSMYNLIADFGLGLLHHCDLAESLRAFYRSRDEMKSEGRDQYIAHLKRTGEYEAEYGM
jgi:TPR repeat protein